MDPFNFRELRVKQPGRLFPGRATYEIFGGKQLVATAREVEARTLLDKITNLLPDTRVLAVTGPAGESLLRIVYYAHMWTVDVADNDDKIIGKIQVGGSRRHYHLQDPEGTEFATAVGDLAVRRFVVRTSDGHPPFAEIQKTFAGPIKETLTSADHYRVRFSGDGEQVSPLGRTLTAIVPIILDLAKYGPA
jgi:hypothetical protein